MLATCAADPNCQGFGYSKVNMYAQSYGSSQARWGKKTSFGSIITGGDASTD